MNGSDRTPSAATVLREREVFWIEARPGPGSMWSCWKERPSRDGLDEELARLRGKHPHAEWRLGRTVEKVEVLDAA